MRDVAAVVLAGGWSRRMGRDKADLSFGGGTLLQHQLETLKRLSPGEIFVSCREGQRIEADVPLVRDSRDDRGPLEGIVSAFEATTAPRLVVLAVDMPFVTPDLLAALVDRYPAGVVPRHPDGRYEPLVAVYPRVALDAARRHLATNRLALHDWILPLVTDGSLTVHTIAAGEAKCFANWNSPGDIIAP